LELVLHQYDSLRFRNVGTITKNVKKGGMGMLFCVSKENNIQPKFASEYQIYQQENNHLAQYLKTFKS